MSPILEMRGITKTFPGVKALDNVNLVVQPGEIHAICGENGAGKSTLMKVLSGVYPHGSYSGDILYEGKTVSFRDISQSEHLGIIIIHQELALVPLLSIAENMFLGNETSRFGIIDWDRAFARTRELLALVGLDENPETLITTSASASSSWSRSPRRWPRRSSCSSSTSRPRRSTRATARSS